MTELYYSVGKIVNTHGVRGELKVVPQTDFPDIRFAKGSKLYVHKDRENHYVPLTVETSRLHKNVYIVKFSGLNEMNEAEKYKGSMLKVTAEDLVDLEDDEYYYHEIIGCQVVTDEDEELGTITEILSPGANDVWVITPENGKSILIPVIDDVLLHVDVQNKLVKIHLLEGIR